MKYYCPVCRKTYTESDLGDLLPICESCGDDLLEVRSC